MITTTNNHIYTRLPKNYLHSSNEENSQRKHAHFVGRQLDSSARRSSAVIIKSLNKLAVHKIPLHAAFVRATIYKLYLLHPNARKNLVICK